MSRFKKCPCPTLSWFIFCSYPLLQLIICLQSMQNEFRLELGIMHAVTSFFTANTLYMTGEMARGLAL